MEGSDGPYLCTSGRRSSLFLAPPWCMPEDTIGGRLRSELFTLPDRLSLSYYCRCTMFALLRNRSHVEACGGRILKGYNRVKG